MTKEGEEEEEEKKGPIDEYIESKKPLAPSKKLQVYKDIVTQYEDSLKNIQFEHGEEDEDQNVPLVNDEDEDISLIAKLENTAVNLDYLLKKLEKPKKQKLDYLDIKKEIKKKSDASPNKSAEPIREVEINDLGDNLFEGGENEAAPKKDKNFIEENKKAHHTKKSDVASLFKMNRELFPKNIPKYLNENKLSRRELHYVYILYKALCEVTSQRHKEYNGEDGIDYHSFRNGIYQVFLQSEELAEKIFYTIDFNFSGFLNWDEFLSAMVKIRAKTMRDKIDLFINIADEDGNGLLSKVEIFNLAKVCLKKFMKDSEDGFLDELCHYFTKLIFSSVGISMDEEIPLQAIKEAIISGNQESDLLAMFCGADI